MAEKQVDFALMAEILQDLQKRAVTDGARMESMHNEMREGFASLKNLQADMYKDHAFLQRRITEAEAEIARIKTALALSSKDKN